MTLLNVTAVDYEFQGIKLYNPTITELSEKINDEDDLFFAIKLLSSSLIPFISENIPQTFSDFDILFALFFEEQASFDLFSKSKIKAIKELLLLLFKDYNISIGKEEFIFSKNNSIFILNANNFTEFQNIIKQMFKTSFLFEGGDSGQEYNPGSEQARRIAEKLKKSREKVAELNGKKEYKTALIENYIMIVATGLHQNPQVLADTLTLYQLLTIFIRVKMKLEWDLDIKCRLAGGNPEEHPDQWMSII